MNDPTELYQKKRYAECLDVLQTLLDNTTDSDQSNAIKCNMSKCYYYLKKPDQAEKIIDELCKTLDEPLLRVDLAMYKNAQGKFDEAYEILTKLPLEHDTVAFNLGWHLARRGDFVNSAGFLNRGRNLNVYGSLHFYDIDQSKIYQGGNALRIAVLMEGGIGDQIIFVRWIDHIKQFCNELTVYCDKGLVDLFRLNDFNAIDIEFFKWATYDKLVPSMAIPFLFKIADPREHCKDHYLKTNYDTSNFKLDGDYKIGIKYIGNTEFEHDLFRQVPSYVFDGIEQYGKLYDLQLDHYSVKNAVRVNELYKINNWMDTYSVLDNLDLVITCCTGIAHLSAAMGKQTIVLLPLVPYFVWGKQSWYSDNVMVIRQTKFDDWADLGRKLNDTVKRFKK
jgi:hypothetical protein